MSEELAKSQGTQNDPYLEYLEKNQDKVVKALKEKRGEEKDHIDINLINTIL